MSVNFVLETSMYFSLCIDHAKRNISLRHRAHQKRKPKESAENLLEGIDHFKLCAGPDGILEHKRVKSSADNMANKALGKADMSKYSGLVVENNFIALFIAED